jgi:hypothetical protein
VSSRYGRNSAVRSSPTSAAVAPRVSRATSGSATWVIAAPSWLTEWPVQNRRKSASRQTESVEARRTAVRLGDRRDAAGSEGEVQAEGVVEVSEDIRGQPPEDRKAWRVLPVTGATVRTPRPSCVAIAFARSLLTMTPGRRFEAWLPRTGSRSTSLLPGRAVPG